MWNLKQLNSYEQRVEWWLPGAGGWGDELLDKGQKRPVVRGVRAEDLMHSMGTTVDNTVLCIWKSLREQT